MWIWGLFCEPSPDTSYVMMTQCEIDMWCQTMAEQHRVIISRFDLEKDFHPGWCSWPLGDHLMFEILDPFSLQGPVQSPMWATIFVVTPLPRPWIPAVETWEIEPVRWLFNMPATRPRNILAICSISVTHWQRRAHFSKHFYHCCRGGWLPCLLRLRKLGVHGDNYYVSFTSNWINWCGSCPVCMVFLAINALCFLILAPTDGFCLADKKGSMLDLGQFSKVSQVYIVLHQQVPLRV